MASLLILGQDKTQQSIKNWQEYKTKTNCLKHNSGVRKAIKTFPKFYLVFKDTHREKAQSNKTPALTKIKNMSIWVMSTSN